MSKSTPLPLAKKLLVALGVWALAIGFGLVATPYLAASYEQGMTKIVAIGDSTQDLSQRLVYYQAADTLSAAPNTLIVKQAATWDKLGEFEKSEQQLNRIAKKGPEALLLQSRVELEKGNAVQAVSYAQASGDKGVQQGFALAAANLSAELEVYIASVSQAEDAKTLMAVKLSKTALAAELLSSGLVRSTQRTIEVIPEGDRGPLDYVILANAQIAQSDYKAAQTSLEASLKLDAANLETHKRYLIVLRKLGADTAKEEAIIKALESGKV